MFNGFTQNRRRGNGTCKEPTSDGNEEALKRNNFSATWMEIYMKMLFYSYSKAQSSEEGIALTVLVGLFSGLSSRVSGLLKSMKMVEKTLVGA